MASSRLTLVLYKELLRATQRIERLTHPHSAERVGEQISKIIEQS